MIMNKIKRLAFLYLVLVVMSLGACGGGNDGASAGNRGKFQTEILFPRENVNLAGSDQITVSGRITDSEDGDVGAADVSQITVNDITATLDTTIAGRWSALIPLNGGTNTITVSAQYSNGETDTLSIDVINTLLVAQFEPRDIIYDVAANRAFVINADTIYVIDTNTQVSSILAKGTFYSDLALDSANNRLLAYAGTVAQLDAIDLSDAMVTTLSSAALNAGPEFNAMNDMELDSANNRMLFVRANQTNLRRAGVFAIDLTTGTRSFISDNTNMGAGVDFASPSSLSLDSANNRALVTEFGSRVLAVNLTSGDRTVISDSSTGTGSLPTFRFSVLDTAANRLLIGDFTSVLSVALDTGDRAIISDATTGSGDAFCSLRNIVADIANNRVIALSSCTTDPLFVISVALDSGDRNILYATAQSGGGIEMSIPEHITLDAERNQLLVTDSGFAQLLAIDLDTGVRREVSAANTPVGAGPALNNLEGLGVDTANNRVIIAESFPAAIFSVDLLSGDRSIISDDTIGQGPLLHDRVYRGVLDIGNNRMFVLDEETQIPEQRLLTVDLSSGDRSILSDASIGAGPDLIVDRGSAYDAANNRLFISSDDVVMQVDASSGDRSIIASAAIGSGINLVSAQDIVIDSDNNRLLINDRGLDAIVAVDISNGDRSLISGDTGGLARGNGPLFSENFGLLVDAQNHIAYVVDVDYPAVFIVDLISGDRAIFSSSPFND